MRQNSSHIPSKSMLIPWSTPSDRLRGSTLSPPGFSRGTDHHLRHASDGDTGVAGEQSVANHIFQQGYNLSDLHIMLKSLIKFWRVWEVKACSYLHRWEPAWCTAQRTQFSSLYAKVKKKINFLHFVLQLVLGQESQIWNMKCSLYLSVTERDNNISFANKMFYLQGRVDLCIPLYFQTFRGQSGIVLHFSHMQQFPRWKFTIETYS